MEKVCVLCSLCEREGRSPWAPAALDPVGRVPECSLYSMHTPVCGCIWQRSVCFIFKKKRLLCTVEINFAFASLWLLISVTWGGLGSGSRICSLLWFGCLELARSAGRRGGARLVPALVAKPALSQGKNVLDDARRLFSCLCHLFPSNSFRKEIFAHWEVCLQKEEFSLSSLLVESGVRINGKKPTLQCFFSVD